MKKICPGALAGAAACARCSRRRRSPGPTVTVRVEGKRGTLLERTAVTLPDTDSVDLRRRRRLDRARTRSRSATGGNWDRQAFVQHDPRRDAHASPSSDYWALWNGSWRDYSYGSSGICEQRDDGGRRGADARRPVAAADFALDAASRSACAACPATVQAGAPVTVSVVVYAHGRHRGGRSAGATVSGGGATADDRRRRHGDARASREPGAVRRQGEQGRASSVSAGERVRRRRAGGAAAAAPRARRRARGHDGAARDVRGRLPTGKVFRRKRAPRELAGTRHARPVRAASGAAEHPAQRRRPLLGVRRRERALQAPLAAAAGGRSGSATAPTGPTCCRSGCRKGRYTIRVVAIDKAGNDSVTKTVIRVR